MTNHVKTPRDPIHCVSCGCELHGTLDTYGDVGAELCFWCWCGGGRVGRAYRLMLETQALHRHTLNQVNAYEIDLNNERGQLLIMQDVVSPVSDEDIDRKTKRVDQMKERAFLMATHANELEDDVIDAKMDYRDALEMSEFWRQATVRT